MPRKGRRARCAATAEMPEITSSDIENALMPSEDSAAQTPDRASAKPNSKFDDARAITEALAPVFTDDCRIVFSSAADDGARKTEQLLALGPKVRALKALDPRLSFQRAAFRQAMANIAKQHEEWRLSAKEQLDWCETATTRLLDACRYTAQATLKLADGRSAPSWLSELLQQEAQRPQKRHKTAVKADKVNWEYRWDDLNSQAVRSQRGSEAGTTDEVAVIEPNESDKNASPIARFADGTEWTVPNITSGEYEEEQAGEARAGGGRELCRYPMKNGASCTVTESSRFGKHALIISHAGGVGMKQVQILNIIT